MVRLFKTTSLAISLLAVLSLVSCASALDGDLKRTLAQKSGGEETPETGKTDNCVVVDEKEEPCDICEKSLLVADDIDTINKAVDWRQVLAGLGALPADDEVIAVEAKIAELVEAAIKWPSFADGKIPGAELFFNKNSLHTYMSLCGYGFDTRDNLLLTDSTGGMDDINDKTLSLMNKEQLYEVQAKLDLSKQGLNTWASFSLVADAIDASTRDIQANKKMLVQSYIDGKPLPEPAKAVLPFFYCAFCNNLVNFSECKANNPELLTLCEKALKGELYVALGEELSSRSKELDKIMETRITVIGDELNKAIDDAKKALEECKAVSCPDLKALETALSDAQKAYDIYKVDPKTYAAENDELYQSYVQEKDDIKERLNNLKIIGCK